MGRRDRNIRVASAIWIGAPLIFIGVWLFGIIDEKFPELMGDFGDDTEEEQDND